MTAVEFANTVTNLPTEKQNEFFASLKDILSEEEWNATVQYISWIGLFKSPAKYKHLRTAISEELFGMEIPMSVKSMWDE